MVDMVNLELSRVMRKIIEQSDVSNESEVVVITDEARHGLARALALAARAEGATVTLQLMPQTDTHSEEPPRVVSAGLKEADIAFIITTHSITHTDGYRAAKESGTRISSMRGVTEDMFVHGGVSTDFEELDEVTIAVRDRLNAAEYVRVTTALGTELTFDIADRPAFVLAVLTHDLNQNIGSFPGGESPVSPKEGSAHGTIVVDFAMDNVGILEEPIELRLEDGRVVEISGGTEASQLRDLWDRADDNATNLAEFAIATNKDARLNGGIAEVKKRRGTIHFGFGDNLTLQGSVQSDIHIDGVVLKPTVLLDGEPVLEDGELVI